MKENLVRRALALILLNFGTILDACTASSPNQPRLSEKPLTPVENVGRILRRSRSMAESTINFPLSGIKLRLLGRPAHSLVTIVTELSRLTWRLLDVVFYRNKNILFGFYVTLVTSNTFTDISWTALLKTTIYEKRHSLS